MNDLFTWTCEDISLQLFEHSEIVYGKLPLTVWKARWGEGTIQVINDEWNAALVVRFLTWVSTQLPRGWFIRVHDGGDFIVGRYLYLADGFQSVTEKGLAEDLERLRQKQYGADLSGLLRKRQTDVARGNWLCRIPGERFVSDRRELEMLQRRLGAEAFAALTLWELACDFVLPFEHKPRVPAAA